MLGLRGWLCPTEGAHGSAPGVGTSADAAASKTHPQMRGSGRETRGFSYILVGPPPGPMETGTSARATIGGRGQARRAGDNLETMRRILFALVCALPMLSAQSFDPELYAGLAWRMIGPFRGGRTVGAAGIPGQPNVFYIGVNNGGVWKTDDYGRTWNPIFADQPPGSIAAIGLAP